MVQIFIGIVLILIGIGSMGSPIVWIGGFIVGALLIIKGSRKITHKKKSQIQNEFFQKNGNSIAIRILEGESVDSIANDLFTNHKIPVPVTYDFCCGFLFESLKENDATQKEKILKLIKKQQVDSKVSIGENMNYFSIDSTVIKLDETAQIFLNNKKKNGLLVISKAHIFFFPKNKSIVSKIGETLWDKLYSVPGLGLVIGLFDLIFAIHSETQKPLSSSKISSLKKQFEKGNCSVATISEIEKFDTTEIKSWFLTSKFVSIKSKGGSELCLGTTGSSEEKWVDALKRQISIVALAEGNLLAH